MCNVATDIILSRFVDVFNLNGKTDRPICLTTYIGAYTHTYICLYLSSVYCEWMWRERERCKKCSFRGVRSPFALSLSVSVSVSLIRRRFCYFFFFFICSNCCCCRRHNHHHRHLLLQHHLLLLLFLLELLHFMLLAAPLLESSPPPPSSSSLVVFGVHRSTDERTGCALLPTHFATCDSFQNRLVFHDPFGPVFGIPFFSGCGCCGCCCGCGGMMG